MVHSMPLKNGQSFKVKIGTFGTSLVKYNVMNTCIGFWQIAETDARELKLRVDALSTNNLSDTMKTSMSCTKSYVH